MSQSPQSIAGYARAQALTKAERLEIAHAAIAVRWKKPGARKRHADAVRKSWEKRRKLSPNGLGWTYQTPSPESAS